MKTYGTLMRLFLLERFAGLRNLLRGKAFKGSLNPRALGKGVLYAAVYAMLVGYVIGFEVLLMNGYAALGMPEMLLSAALMVSIVLTAVLSLFYVLSQLYMSRDILFLSALPASSRTLFSARLSMALLGEIGISGALYLPALILTGIRTGMGATYYIKGALLWPFLPVMSICLAALLSTVLIRLSSLWKRRESLTTILSFAFLIGVMVLQMSLTNAMGGTELNEIVRNIASAQINMAQVVNDAFPPVRWAYQTLTKGGLAGAGNGLLFAGVSLAAAALVVWLVGGGYQRSAVRQSEALASLGGGRRAKKALLTKRRTPLQALFSREMGEIFKTPVYATNSLSGVIIGPVMLVMAYMGMKQGGEVIDLGAMTAAMPAGILAIGMTALMCFIAMVNPAVCTAISREGKMHGFLRSLPVAPSTALLAKWLMGDAIGVFSTLPTAILVAVFVPSLLGDVALALLVTLLFIGTINALSIWWDAKHPKLSWKSETEAIKQNMNFLSLMAVGFGMLLLHGGLWYLLTTLNLNPTLALLCVAALEIVELFLSLRLLLKRATVAYCLHE